jgi:CubicO group peptidase (beta-lactamase class C family)
MKKRGRFAMAVPISSTVSAKMFLLVLILAIVFGSGRTVAAQVVSSGDLAKKVDEYMKACVKEGNFSGTVLMARKGKILISKGYGMANYELNVRNLPSTKLRLGSITKQFTAMAVMQLQERKRLSVHDPLSKYIPDYPQGDKITIHHLLTHTAGIPNLTSLPEFRTYMVNPSPVQKTIDLFKNKTLDFTPGEKYKYSNSGYIILSYVIEKASGQSYESFVSENIFKPLNMKNSGYDHQDIILKNRASGYGLTDEGLMNAPYIDMSIPSGGGALYSTVGDMYLWDRSLYKEMLVSRESLNAMFTPYKEGYGYGWIIANLNGRKIVTHNGSVNGFVTHIARYVDDDACIVILSNIENSPINEISRDLKAILFGEKYEIPKVHKAVSIDAAIYDAYVGQYEINPKFVLSVTKERDRLFIQGTGQGKIRLYPESTVKFFMKLVTGEVTFVKDGKGEVIQLVIRQLGQNTPAKKIR